MRRASLRGSLATLTAVAVAVAVAVALVALAAVSSPSSSGAAGGPRAGSAGASAERLAPSPPRFGFADDIEQHLLAMDAARDLRASIARITIPWYYSDWASLDEVYGHFYSNGIRPIFTLYISPPGAVLPGPPAPPIVVFDPPQPGPQPAVLPPAPPVPDIDNFKPMEFTEQAVYVAKRYPYAKIQILNEPNLPQFGSFPVEKTVDIIVRTARAVHEVAPGARLIGPASSPDKGRGFAYTRAVYEQLPADLDYVDAATNIYPRPGKKRGFEDLKRSWEAATASGRRVWVTEITPGIYSPRRRRCNAVKQALSYLKAREAKGILLFRLRQPQMVSNVQGRLWAVNLDGSPTDLYRCLSKAVKRLGEHGRPHVPRLRLTVVDRTIVGGGDAVRVRFQITAREDYGSLGQGPKAPVAGAQMLYGSESASTNGRGRAAITVPFAAVEEDRASAQHPRYRGDSALVLGSNSG